MKKMLCTMLVLTFIASLLAVPTANATVLTTKDEYLSNPNAAIAVDASGGIRGWDRNRYIGFENVDLTGIKSITVSAKCKLPGGSNGEGVAVMLDEPYGKSDSVNCLGYIVLGRESADEGDSLSDYSINVTNNPGGIHDIYFVGSYGSNNASNIKIYSFTLNTTEVEVSDNTVDDSYTYELAYDTWALTDELGRKVADYSEAGPVKEGKHDVGMFYWNWFTSPSNKRAYIPSKIIAKYPKEKDNYNSPVWDTMGVYWWAEPLLGFYDAYDYWTYRRHGEMLTNAGVDFILFDYSNGGLGYIKPLYILADSFRDAKKEGIKVPKITAMTDLGGRADNSLRLLQSMYFNCFVSDDYSDLWYYLDDKPLLYANSVPSVAEPAATATYADGTVGINYREKEVLNDIEEFFTFRRSGGRTGPTEKSNDRWLWLEDFPIHSWNYQEDTGRYEFCAVGVGINESYIYKLAATGVFSDEYTKGRGYSEAFGEDRTENGMHMAYYFRDQSSMALEIDPEIVAIDGWNEWTAIRNASYNGFKNSFVDNFDDENSRDFEPSAGVLRDHYYNLLIDFIRKYKGVEKPPVAGEALAIDVTGGSEQWADVVPEYTNYPSESRNDYGYQIAPLDMTTTDNVNHHYVYNVYNNILSAKVSYDEDNFYFMAKTEEDITTDTPHAMQLYLDTDRNKATGWNGYDYAVNVTGLGKVSENVNNSWEWNDISEAEYSVSGNVMMLKVKRLALSENSDIDFEFKWTDGIDLEEEILNVYKGGNAAPPYRYNYIYSTSEQVYPGDIFEGLSGNAVIKAGANKMTTGESLITVYEPDTRVTPIALDGTLYVPEDALHEIIGYGKSKSWYDGGSNTFRFMKYDLTPYEDENGVTQNTISSNWGYTVIGTTEMYLDGTRTALSNPIKVIDGIIFVPLSLLSDAFGFNVNVDNSGMAIVTKPGKTAISSSIAQSVCELFN